MVDHRRRLGAHELRRDGTSEPARWVFWPGVCALIIGALHFIWPLVFMFTFHPA